MGMVSAVMYNNWCLPENFHHHSARLCLQWSWMICIISFHLLVLVLYLLVMFRHATQAICGEPSTECSSGQPQCSAHGQRIAYIRTHSPRFPCWSILQCWWSPYEMNNEKTGSLAHNLFIQGCPRSFTCLNTEHEYKAPSSFMLHAIVKLLSLCWWK